jgi:hypothetical protein
MQKILVGIMFLFLPVLGLAQVSAASSSYQPATITQVKPHLSTEASDPSQVVYEVSVKVDGTTYVVLTKSPSGESTILYAVGRELLVHVGDTGITWNDILGQSHEVPIISRSPVVEISKSQK